MRTQRTFLTTLSFTLALAGAANAYSHTRWNPESLTPGRTDSDALKSGPCGNVPRTNSPTVLEAGSTVTVEFESTIFHQGDFRIAFSEANDTGFDESVLVTDIPDYANQRYRSQEITLPDIECDQCTLQLIQVMRDRTPPTNYYACADIQLTRNNSVDTTPPAPVANVLGVPGDGSAMLSWSNPNDADFAGVLLLQHNAPFIAIPDSGQMYSLNDAIGDAQVRYVGGGESANINNLDNDRYHYFALYSYDSNFNYSTAVGTDVELTAQSSNIAPRVSLHWEQADNTTNTVTSGVNAADVIIQARVNDDNPNDSHSYDWSHTNSNIMNISTNDTQLRFSPRGLAEGDYDIELLVSDDGEPVLTTSAQLSLEVRAKSDDEEQQSSSGGSSHWWLLMALTLLGAGATSVRRKRLLSF